MAFVPSCPALKLSVVMKKEHLEIITEPSRTPRIPASPLDRAPAPNGHLRWPETLVARNSAWRKVMALCGSVVLSVCPRGREACSVANCRLRPFCACARADQAAENRTENRVWLAVGILGMVVIALALAWSLTQQR